MRKDRLNPTLNSLSPKVRGEVVGVLNAALADLTDLYFQAKHAHWNVRGRRFPQLHALFDEVSASIFPHLDDVAERVVQLGGYAEGTVRMMSSRSRLKEWPADMKEADEFVASLADRVGAAAHAVREAIDVTGGLGDASTADLLTGVSRSLDKNLWMLEASQ